MPYVITMTGIPIFFSEVDRPLIEAHTWRVEKTGRKHYVMNGDGEYLHRLILGLEPGDPRLGDHRNRCTMDNSRGNLFIVTDQQNCWNVEAIPRANNTLGVRGVTQVGDRFQARMYIDGIRTSLGYFDTAEQAGEAYAKRFAIEQSRIMEAQHA